MITSTKIRMIDTSGDAEGREGSEDAKLATPHIPPNLVGSR